MTRNEKFVIFTVIGVVAVMSSQSFVPALKVLDRSAIIALLNAVILPVQGADR